MTPRLYCIFFLYSTPYLFLNNLTLTPAHFIPNILALSIILQIPLAKNNPSLRLPHRFFERCSKFSGPFHLEE